MSILTDNTTTDAPICGWTKLLSKKQILPKIKYLIVSTILFSTLISPALASYTDVSNSHTNFNAISYLTANTEVSGFGSEEFKPERYITRAELIKSLVTLKFSADEIGNCTDVVFDDIGEENSFFNYICIAYKKNIVAGYSDNAFKPNEKVALKSAGKMILNTLEGHNDDDKYLMRLNHLKAIPTSIECKQANITRGEAAEIIYRIENNITDRDHTEITDLRECNSIFVSPLKTCVNKYYMSRGYSRGHTGIDFPVKMVNQDERCEVNSVGYGIVEQAHDCRSLGNCVVIRHDNGMRSLYAHLTSEFLVKEGDKVIPGQKIGVMGRTGVAYGTHLHFSISVNDTDVISYRNRVNPTGIIPF